MTGEPTGAHARLIGRGGEVEEIERRLATERLVTLTGVGGVGKTTIAREVARRAARTSAVAFVDLVPFGSVDAVVGGLAIAAGALDDPDNDPVASIAAALDGHPTILVLDNFEHVLDAAPAVDRLLAMAAGARILVTSRIGLGLPGESIVRITPLALPRSSAELEEAPASALYLGRARELGRLLLVEPGEAAAILEICRRLDGLPLAIELAAAWCRILSPLATVRRLVEGRFDLSGDDVRHGSVNAIVRSSLELVGPAERAVFPWLGVCAAAFDEAAAAAVCADDRVLRAIRGLESVALVRATNDAAGEPQFALLETIRAIALESLSASGRLGEARRRYAVHFADRAVRAADAVRTASFGSREAGRTLADPNMPAAYEAAIAVGDDENALRIASALASRAMQTGVFGEALARLGTVADRPGVSAGVRSDGLNALVSIRGAVGQVDGLAKLAEAAVACAREADDPIRIVRTLITLGNWSAGDRRATYREAAAIADRIGYHWGASVAWGSLSSAKWDAGDPEGALETLERARAASDRAGDRTAVGHWLDQLGEYELNLGRLAEALQHLEEAAAILREAPGTPFFETTSLTLLAIARALTGDPQGAYRILVDAAGRVETGEAVGEPWDWLEAAIFVLESSHPAAAARALGAVDRSTRELGPRPSDALRASAGRRLARALGDRRLERERSAGLAAEPRALVTSLARLVRREAGPGPGGLSGPFGALTVREQEILTHLAAGATDRDIATALRISPKTASVHVANLKAKLGVETRVEAALFARDRLGGEGPGAGEGSARSR